MSGLFLFSLGQSVSPAPTRPLWIGVALVIVLVIAVVLVSIKNAKRSHQD